MKKNHIKKSSADKKAEFQQTLVDQFTKMVDSGETDEFVANWISKGANRNGISKKSYRGMNQIMLALVAQEKGYDDPRWYTFNQITDAKGTYHKGEEWHLQKGSKGTMVQYWQMLFFLVENGKKGKKITAEEAKKIANDPNDNREVMSVPVVNVSTVFNGSCIEGLPPLDVHASDLTDADEFVKKATAALGVDFAYDGGDRSYYRPSTDSIHLPLPERFVSAAALNGTALHELSHSTGAAKRLNRIGITNSDGFGGPIYAEEELIAELSAAFLAINLGDGEAFDFANIPEEARENKQHRAYLQSWLSDCNSKATVLEKAIKQAQKAADYIEEAVAKYENESAVTVQPNMVVPTTTQPLVPVIA